jgi:DNA repair protein RecO (recombination protein O)
LKSGYNILNVNVLKHYKNKHYTMGFIQVQPAYILYVKPFRDTSVLLEVFSYDYGRVSLVGRGARALTGMRGSRPRFQGLLQPFVPLMLSWKGKTDLLTLVAAEPRDAAPVLEGKVLFSAWYLNELLVRSLKPADAHPELFNAYQMALYGLSHTPELSLRRFEKEILQALGVFPQFNQETQTGQGIQPEKWYKIRINHGISIEAVLEDRINETNVFQGEMLLALRSGHWGQLAPYLNAIKKLFRMLLNHVLADSRIRSRELFSCYIS